MNATQQRKVQSIYPVVRYNDAKAAIRWLTSVLGFEENVVYPGEGESIGHAARAKAAGADIIRELEETDYGSREFGVRDAEGHVWSFGTYRPQAE